jgi:hypothetical protein
MRGEEMRKMLHNLANNFRELAVPAHGRYSKEAAITDEGGVSYIPKPERKVTPAAMVVAGVAMVALTAWLVYRGRKDNALIS